jgi:hypothetical protein
VIGHPRDEAHAEQLARRLKRFHALLKEIGRRRLDIEAESVALARTLVSGTEFTVVSELDLRAFQHRTRELADAMSERDREFARLQRSIEQDEE